MKTYKHKKTGEVAEEYPDYYKTRYWNTVNDIPKRLVEDSSDWYEVTPKEWEILEFAYPSQWGEETALRDKDGIYRLYSGQGWTLDRLLNVKEVRIHSVKRLSDNTIITLGDTLIDQTVKGIVIRAEGKQCWLQSDLKNPDYGCCLSVAKKVEELHTTQDGYEISTGDTYYIADNFRVREVLGGTFTKSKWDGKRFKIKENAENWILRNKQCLSLNDVLANTDIGDSEIDELEFLIKTRL